MINLKLIKSIFFLTGDKFMPELRLKQLGFSKIVKEFKKFRETGN